MVENKVYFTVKADVTGRCCWRIYSAGFVYVYTNVVPEGFIDMNGDGADQRRRYHYAQRYVASPAIS
jgi:hypothetical protein